MRESVLRARTGRGLRPRHVLRPTVRRFSSCQNAVRIPFSPSSQNFLRVLSATCMTRPPLALLATTSSSLVKICRALNCCNEVQSAACANRLDWRIERVAAKRTYTRTKKRRRSIKWGKKLAEESSSEKGIRRTRTQGTGIRQGMKCNTYHLEERKEEEKDRNFVVSARRPALRGARLEPGSNRSPSLVLDSEIYAMCGVYGQRTLCSKTCLTYKWDDAT